MAGRGEVSLPGTMVATPAHSSLRAAPVPYPRKKGACTDWDPGSGREVEVARIPYRELKMDRGSGMKPHLHH